MSRIIVFASGKGGVGKSTIVANLAIAGAELGKNALLLDADIPMADLALSLGLDIEGPTIHEVLSEEVDIQDAIHPGPKGIRILPSGISLDGVRKAKPKNLEKLIKEVSNHHDLILIDAPPGLGAGALSVLRNSDELVLITTPEVSSLSDALLTKEVTERFNTNPLGAVISRTYDNGSDVPESQVEAMLDLPVLAMIPEDPEIQKSSSLGEPVMLRKPDSPSVKAIRKLAEEIFEKRGMIDYQALAEKTISEIKNIAEERDIDYSKLLEVEKKNKNRKGLKSWLEPKIEKSGED